MKDAFMMSREELLAKTVTDSEKGLTPEQVEKSRSTYGTNSFVRQSHRTFGSDYDHHRRKECQSI